MLLTDFVDGWHHRRIGLFSTWPQVYAEKKDRIHVRQPYAVHVTLA